MTIPLVDLKAQYSSIKDEIDAAIQRVLESADFILGEEVSLFEGEFASFCDVNEAVGVSSGTEALHLALLACDVGAGDEVITTTFTFTATAEAISQVGAKPVFVDVDPLSCNLDPKRIEAAITERTRAILPVHLYGRPADMDGILDVARRFGLKVVEDAAQAHGALYKDMRAGTMGDAGCFSFYPGKNLGAYGDGGMVVTNDHLIADRIRLLRDHGRTSKYEHVTQGFNGRLDTLQAAVLRVKLCRLEMWNARRRDMASLYRELLREHDVAPLPEEEQVEPVYHLFVIRTADREHLLQALNRSGIGAGIHYPIPLHLQPAYRHLEYRVGDFPEAERAAREVLSLPLYPELTQDQALEVARAIVASLSVPLSAD